MDPQCRHIIFSLLLVLAVACAAPAAGPRATSRVDRIGYLGTPPRGPTQDVFFAELDRLGYRLPAYRMAITQVE